MMRPVSMPASTTKTVQPVTLTPYASVSRTACAPENAGSSAGWVLMKRSPKRARNAAPTSFMKPAETTRSGWYESTRSASPTSQATRSSPLPSGWTKVGTPAARARSSPWAPALSEPTATISASRIPAATASSTVCSSVPDPDSRTTTLKGRGVSTALPYRRGLVEPRAPPRRDRRPRRHDPRGHTDEEPRDQGPASAGLGRYGTEDRYGRQQAQLRHRRRDHRPVSQTDARADYPRGTPQHEVRQVRELAEHQDQPTRRIGSQRGRQLGDPATALVQRGQEGDAAAHDDRRNTRPGRHRDALGPRGPGTHRIPADDLGDADDARKSSEDGRTDERLGHLNRRREQERDDADRQHVRPGEGQDEPDKEPLPGFQRQVVGLVREHGLTRRHPGQARQDEEQDRGQSQRHERDRGRADHGPGTVAEQPELRRQLEPARDRPRRSGQRGNDDGGGNDDPARRCGTDRGQHHGERPRKGWCTHLDALALGTQTPHFEATRLAACRRLTRAGHPSILASTRGSWQMDTLWPGKVAGSGDEDDKIVWTHADRGEVTWPTRTARAPDAQLSPPRMQFLRARNGS